MSMQLPPPKAGWKRMAPFALWGLAVLVLGVVIGAVVASDDDTSETEAVGEVSGTSAPSEEDDEPTTTRRRATTTTIDLESIKAAYEAQVAESCAAAAGARLDKSDSEVAQEQAASYDSDWFRHASRSEFVAAVESCAAPERQARLASECAAEPPVELLNRNPDQYSGQCFTLVVSIVQFDQGTGPCAFRVRFDTEAREYNFEYRGENALVTFRSPCPELDAVGNDDVLRLRAVVVGGLDYDTTIGGRTSAVHFTAVGDFDLLQDN